MNSTLVSIECSRHVGPHAYLDVTVTLPDPLSVSDYKAISEAVKELKAAFDKAAKESA